MADSAYGGPSHCRPESGNSEAALVTGGKVLVLGDDTRSFLAIVRSIGRQGITVHAVPSNFRSPAVYSRYVAAIHDLPPWIEEGGEWLASIEALLRAERYDLVIPCNETTLLPLQRHRATLEALAPLAIPDDRAIDTFFDKHATRELARQAGVPVAVGRLARPDDTPEAVLAEFGAPVVVKPRRSYSLDTLAVRGKVQLVGDPAGLASLLRASAPDETLLEGFFTGNGVGVSVLASRGRVLQAFEHHRVREIAGASFYRVSAPLTPHLERACAAVVAALDFTGLAMFEFKVNASGVWVLLEANARPWGSLPLPLALGVDFPYRWYRLLIAGEESAAVSYRTGIYGRNLVPDLQNSLIEATTRQLGRAATAWFMLRRLAELSRLVTWKEVNDVLVHDDPRPGFIELLQLARAACNKVSNKLPSAAARRRRRARAQIARMMRQAPDVLRILFVCQGNICRSPFAAALLRTRLPHRPIEVGSAGMLPRPGRPTPALGLVAAAAHGVDLSTHRSQWLTRGMAEAAALLIVFDEITLDAVRDRYPDLRVPITRLGDAFGLGDIADPVDGGSPEFDRAYSLIATAVATLERLLHDDDLSRRIAQP